MYGLEERSKDFLDFWRSNFERCLNLKYAVFLFFLNSFGWRSLDLLSNISKGNKFTENKNTVDFSHKYSYDFWHFQQLMQISHSRDIEQEERPKVLYPFSVLKGATFSGG